VTTQVPLPTGSYVARDPRVSCKRLVNFMSEIGPQTSATDTKQKVPPITIRRAPGIVGLANDSSNKATRGLHTMGAATYAVIGANLYAMSATGALLLLGSGIPGTGFVRMADNGQCLFILIPGTSIAYTFCPNAVAPAPLFALFTDPTFLSYGALDVWFVDSYLVFLALNGLEFYNDDGQLISGTGVPTFTTFGVFPREFGTDLLWGMCVDHREVLVFGALTSEGYMNVGTATGSSAGSPFGSAPNSFMQIGVHPLAGYTVALQDQSVFWVANDLTVRRRNGQTPTRVSNHGIEAVLEKANLAGCYALTPTIGGHPLWVLTMPAAGNSLVYDCVTTEWFEMESFGVGCWRPLCWLNAFGKQLVGDSQGNGVGYLDTTVFTEFGVQMQCSFTTQGIYDGNNRICHNRLELVISAGEGASLTYAPKVTLYISDDGGRTFWARDDKNLGESGQYGNRCVWFKLGQSRCRVYRFLISDAAPTYTVDVTAELDGGKW